MIYKFAIRTPRFEHVDAAVVVADSVAEAYEMLQRQSWQQEEDPMGIVRPLSDFVVRAVDDLQPGLVLVSTNWG